MKKNEFKMTAIALFFLLGLFFLSSLAFSHGDLALPELPAPEDYGDVLMDRVSSKNKVVPVVFPPLGSPGEVYLSGVPWRTRIRHEGE